MQTIALSGAGLNAAGDYQRANRDARGDGERFDRAIE